MLMKLRIFYLTIIIFSCSFCSLKPQQPAHIISLDRPTLEKRLQTLSCWHITARLGLISINNKGHAKLTWQQNFDNYDINISTPLQFENLRLHGNNNTISLTNKHGITSHFCSFTELNKHTNIEIPWQSLFFWIKGLSSPLLSITQQKYNPNNTLAYLLQQNWNIKYISYTENAGILLPRKIIIQHQGLTLTILIQQWLVL